jgi:hypothetical protein
MTSKGRQQQPQVQTQIPYGNDNQKGNSNSNGNGNSNSMSYASSFLRTSSFSRARILRVLVGLALDWVAKDLAVSAM